MTILLILLCCFMGAVSAAEDVSTDVVDASVDDTVTIDAVSEDIVDSTSVEETPVEAVDDVTIEPAIPDDTTTEEISEEIHADEINEESAVVDSEPTRATDVNVSSWADLRIFGASSTDYNIYLKSSITVDNNVLVFQNNAHIIGTPNNYITGGRSNKIPFQSIGNLNITFTNVTFKNMNASVLIKLASSYGINKFINCTFNNIYTSAYKSSVIWNDNGTMIIKGCNFTKCNDGFGAVTNFATNGTVRMNVSDCRFVNNTGRLEPGAINNCGNLNVTNCTFIHNTAGWWAGAIHTHTNSSTRIVGSTFTDNVAGWQNANTWNGGALFSYGKLVVINSTFTGNNCTASTGGGAIFGYSYQGSIYNITVDSCNFTRNTNNHTSGLGGAIGVQNVGYLTVFNSIFIDNHATKNGSAIASFCENVTYCNNCTNCSCPNCPNCSNCTHNVSTGDPDSDIHNNTFINHTGPADTIFISGNHYVYYGNNRINSYQSINYNESENRSEFNSDGLNSIHHITLGSNLGSSILSFDNSDVFYVNGSKEYDENMDGQSWETAAGGDRALFNIVPNLNSNGIIYLADTFTSFRGTSACKDFTVIGLSRENTIVNQMNWWVGTMEEPDHYLVTYINMTFINPGVIYGNDVTFINCTFINFKTSEPINDGFDENVEYGVEPPEESFVTNFINCDFINSTIAGQNLFDVAKYTQINFDNCNFENIEADSIVSSYKGKFHTQDGINFNGCKFTNVTTKGIVSIPTGNEISELVHIEGCTFDVPVTNEIKTYDGRDYINTTQDRADSNLTMDIDGDNLVISLKDSEGNPIVDVDEINVLVNEESIPCQMENGVATLNISDLSGKVTFSATFEGNSNYKDASASLSTYIVVKTVTETVIQNVTVEVPVPIDPVATAITASDITATAKIAKTLSITLKDANGNPLANKAVKVTVNGKTSTVNTDSNGVAKVTVNYAKAGTYYYTFTYLGDNDYKASLKPVKVTVNKQATKATFAKKTFKVKATKKISFTLKDSKGKAIAKKKITFKVNGKTYTATTNSKGVATVKIVIKKKGKYTATAKFAGDTTYKAISKKATITIR